MISSLLQRLNNRGKKEGKSQRQNYSNKSKLRKTKRNREPQEIRVSRIPPQNASAGFASLPGRPGLLTAAMLSLLWSDRFRETKTVRSSWRWLRSRFGQQVKNSGNGPSPCYAGQVWWKLGSTVTAKKKLGSTENCFGHYLFEISAHQS